ncbi:MAG: MBOAT family protein [Alloprevotella sp.]|nr:MBOAT family protein [Alloprevotella sp.]
MSFSSFEYLLFLPIVFLAYWYLCPTLRAKNALVVGASYFFYGWWDWRFTLLLALTTLLSYGGGLAEAKWREQEGRAKAAMWVVVGINLGILSVFKYYNFFADSTRLLFARLGWAQPSLPLLEIILPVGISFYTFQALSYVIDVRRGRLQPTRDVLAFFAYLSFFPQLVAGPIERATHLLPQFLGPRRFNYAQAVSGMRQMLWGFFKKVVVADGCAEGVNAIFADYQHMNSTTLLMGIALFSVQIYGDFSGYSDIAIGTARLFGIDLMQNFRLPYFARSISDFWRRWHISLMTWLRDYVYIPLGGSREDTWRHLRNTLLVFLCSGLWHGAAWTFVLWGLYHALLFAPRILLGRQRVERASASALRKIGQTLRTFCLVAAGWLLFRSPTLSDAVQYAAGIFSRWSFAMPAYGKTMLPLVVAMFAAEWLTRRYDHPLQVVAQWRSNGLRIATYFAIAATVLYHVGNDVRFIYFQF